MFVVAGLEGLSNREHEARAHWHCFHFIGCLSLFVSLSLSYWFHLGERVGSWGEVWQSSLNLNYDITLSRGGWARFPQLWSYFWPSFTCVCRLLLGWKGCPFKSMKQELFDIVFASSVVFNISAYCNLCERVCSCLLLMGWNGCRLVYLFAVARVQGLAQALFRRLGSSAPLPSLLSLLLLGGSLSICSWGGSACSSANLGAKYLQKIMFSPLCAVFSISCHYFLCNLPLPLFLQGWKGCLLTTGVVSIYLIVVDGKQWALKGRLGKVLSAMALPLRSFKHVLHFSFPVLVFVCSRWVGRVVQ